MDDLTLNEFVLRRKKEILKQIRALRGELSQLRTIEHSVATPSTYANKEGGASKKGGGLTFQDMVVEVLKRRPQGAGAKELLILIKDFHGKSIMRSSLSPQLSRLKSNGVLSLEGGIWRLTQPYLVDNTHPDAGLDERVQNLLG